MCIDCEEYYMIGQESPFSHAQICYCVWLEYTFNSVNYVGASLDIYDIYSINVN